MIEVTLHCRFESKASHMLSSFFDSNLLGKRLLQALAGSYSDHPPAKVAAAPPGMWPVRVDGPKRPNQRSRLLCVCSHARKVWASHMLWSFFDSNLPFKNNCLAQIWSGSEEGSYLRLIDCCITQL